jgi:TetR/AcrR family transcriptional regulator
MQQQRKTKQERSERTRKKILEAALQEFSLRGFEAVSLREIAVTVGVNHGMIRYYFGNKDALWRESAAYLFKRMASETDVNSLPKHMTARERFETYLRGYVRYCARHPEHARLMVQESCIRSDRLEWVAENFIRPGHLRLMPMMLKLIDERKLPDVDPVLMIYSIVAMAQIPYLLSTEIGITHGLDVQQADLIDAHVETVLRLVFRD